MKRMLIIVCLGMSGCSTSQETLMPVDEDASMVAVWQRQTGGNTALYVARLTLRRPLSEAEQQESQSDFSRTAENEIHRRFPRLSNPDMLMYVFPHLNGNTPVPGYSTVFPFYSRTQYALPGERTGEL